MGICSLIASLLVLASLLWLSTALSDAEAAAIARPQMASLPKNHEYKVDVKKEKFLNRRLRGAYIALQAWKKAMSSDPYGVTENWVGPNMCDYEGVFCEQALDDPSQMVVAGIDLNHTDIAGYIPAEFGLLTDLALVHLNSNRVWGIIPGTFVNLRLLHELGISNNRFTGTFPVVLEKLPGLKYLDVRFNYFKGDLSCELFNKDFDALLLNNNKFTTIPDNIGNSPVSVVVLARNSIKGRIPRSIGNMSRTLNEIIFSHNKMSGGIPDEIGQLKELRVLDISSNSFTGRLPKRLRNLWSLEQFDISGNKLKGSIPGSICDFPNLKNFTFGHNYFQETPEECHSSDQNDDSSSDGGNCPTESCEGAHSKKTPRFPCPLHSVPSTSILVPWTHPPAPAPTLVVIPKQRIPRPDGREGSCQAALARVSSTLCCLDALAKDSCIILPLYCSHVLTFSEQNRHLANLNFRFFTDFCIMFNILYFKGCSEF